MRFSYSMLSTWQKCPLQAKFHYLDKMPSRPTARMAYGSCLHAAVEHYIKHGDKQEAVNHFERLWFDPTQLDYPESLIWPKFFSHSRGAGDGRQAVIDFADRWDWERHEVIATEHPFEVAIGEHTVSGFIDLLEVSKASRSADLVKVWDWKASRVPYKNEARYNLQATVYHYAVRQRELWVGNGTEKCPGLPNGADLYEQLKDLQVRMAFYSLQGSKEVDAGPRTQQDFDQMYGVMCQIARAIELDLYIPIINAENCEWCDHREACGRPVPVPDDSDEAAL